MNAGDGFSFTGTFGLSINNRITVDATDTVAAIDGAVSETFIFGDNIVDLDLPAGPFLRIEGSGIEMNLGGQAIKANFSFEKSTSKVVTNPNRADGVAPTYGAERDVIKVAVSGLEFAIGDGTTDFVVVSGGTGNVVLYQGNAGTPVGSAGEFAATVDVQVPGVNFVGTFGVQFNNTGADVNETLTVGRDDNDDPVEVELNIDGDVRVPGVWPERQARS